MEDGNRMRAAPGHEALVRAALAPPELARPAFAEWSRRVDVQALDFSSQRLLPLVAGRSDLDPGPEGLDEQLRRITRFTWIKTQYLIARTVPALAALRDAGIPAMLVKGAAVLAHTGLRAQERPMTDFDVMVPPADAPAAVEVLRATGFDAPGFPADPKATRVYEEIPGYNFHDSVGGEFDLHWAWSARGLRDGGADSWWEAATPGELRGESCLLPRREDLVLQAIAHATLFSSKDAPSRWLPDAVLLVRSAGGGFDWDRLVRQARAARLSSAVADALDYASTLRCLDVPAETRGALARARAHAGPLERIELRPIPPGWLDSGRRASRLELLGDELVAWERRRTFARSRRSLPSAECVPLALGEEASFRAGAPATAARLTRGWYTPDTSGAWSGRRAVVRIALAEPAPGPLRAQLTLVPLLSEARPELNVTLRACGRTVAHWHFRGTGWQPESPSVRLPVQAGATSIELRFAVDRPASPHSLGIDGDIRILGVQLVSVRLEPASDGPVLQRPAAASL